LMLKEGEKKIMLRIQQVGPQIRCVIEDNGIGRSRAAEIKAQKIGANHFDSKGLKLSQQRIQLLEMEGKKGTVEIEDLYENNMASGTRVLIQLPLVHN
jgi:sensor histidine kinase regulating citrate/malate metabolism